MATGERVIVLDPATSREMATPWSSEQAALLLIGASWRDAFGPDEWVVRRTSSARAYHIEVGERATGETVVAMDFDRRIELATSVISPSSRLTVFIQANNLASELTLIDAATASVQSLTIPHDAPLAAFSIDAAFSSDETCLAVSMERSGGPGPETWLIDLDTGVVAPARPGAVIGWV